jgi:periplasmic protein TonB
MNRAAQLPGSPWLDDGWRRFTWIAPLGVALWLSLLAVFADLLMQTPPPPTVSGPVEAQIVEVPAPAGVQGSASASHAPAAPKPVVVVHPPPPHPHPRPRHMLVHPAPPVVPPSAEGTAKSPPPTSAAKSAPAPAANTGAATGAGAGGAASGTAASGGGLGNDSSGARAIYAPTPEIPDDMREEAMVAVAVAHFEVGYDGHVQVTLTQPTMNPELNELLLTTLKQWRFAPATHNGVAIESQFDVRIPVTIQ